MVRPSPERKQGGGIGTASADGLRYSRCRPRQSAAIHPSSETRMNEEFDQSARELEVLAESSRLLTSTLDLGEVLDRLADIAQARLDVDIARIWLLDDAGEFLGAARADRRHPRHRRPQAAVVAARVPRRLGPHPQGARLHRRRAGGHAAGQPRVVRGRGGGLAPHRADHARRPADRDPRVPVAHAPGVHAGRRGAGAGADRAGGGGGAQRRALRGGPGAARGDRGVPARGVGDPVLPRARDRAPRGGPRAARAPPLRRRPVLARGPARRAGCAC